MIMTILSCHTSQRQHGRHAEHRQQSVLRATPTRPPVTPLGSNNSHGLRRPKGREKCQQKEEEEPEEGAACGIRVAVSPWRISRGFQLALERIIGTTANTAVSVAVCNGVLPWAAAVPYARALRRAVTGNVAYPAGAVVVVYNPRRNKQSRFLLSRNHKVCGRGSGAIAAVRQHTH